MESKQSRFMMYALSEYCGKRFFLTREKILWEKGWGDQRKSIEHLFQEELRMLKRSSMDDLDYIREIVNGNAEWRTC